MPRVPSPGFVAGTSSEYLGRRPLRRIVRERPVVVLLGPTGVGKTSVARRIASDGGRDHEYASSSSLRAELVKRARRGRWSARWLQVPALVLDGPTMLRSRPGVEEMLVDLVTDRAADGLQTLICGVSDDGSAEAILDRLEAGTAVILGLRFPNSVSGRKRFARRQCEKMGIPRACAKHTETIDPWGYEAVIARLERCREAGGPLPEP